MDTPSNKETVQVLFDNLWTDPDRARSVCTDDVTWVTTRGVPIPGAEDTIEHVGFEAVHFVATSSHRLATGYRPETIEFLFSRYYDVEGGDVVYRFTMTCETKVGKRYTNDYLFFVEMRDGKVARFQEYWDSKHAYDLLLAGV